MVMVADYSLSFPGSTMKNTGKRDENFEKS